MDASVSTTPETKTTPSTAWLDKPEQWEAIAAHADKVHAMGVDSETYGHDVRASSPAYRARVHVWSIAFYTGAIASRGYPIARGCVLPAIALEHPAIRRILADPSILKDLHNAHHDQHSFANHGVKLAGIRDTLDLVRLAYPERALNKALGFRLKPLARDLLGKPKRDEYNDIVNDCILLPRVKEEKSCVCGDPKCRKRKEPWHTKTIEQVLYEVPMNVVYKLEDIVPGHKRWFPLLDYAAIDAIDAHELAGLAMKKLGWWERTLPPIPWEV